MCPRAGVAGGGRQPWSLLGRWSVLTYEAPKQSPPAPKEEENGDSNIQVGTTGDRGLEMGEDRLGGRSSFTPSTGSGHTGWDRTAGAHARGPWDWGCEGAGSCLCAMK